VIAAASCGLGEAMAGMNVSDLAELPRLASRARPWPDSAGSRFGIRGCGHQRLRRSSSIWGSRDRASPSCCRIIPRRKRTCSAAAGGMDVAWWGSGS
jgi:hypothetical protein